MDEQPPPGPGLPPPPPASGPRRAARLRRAPPAALAARRRAGVAVVVGGTLVVLGVFLPWVSATTPLGAVNATASESGIAIGTWGTLILGGLALMRGLSMLRPATFRFNRGTPLIGGVLLAVLMAARWGDLQQIISATDAQGPMIHASLGIGVWSTIAGTVLIIAGSVIGIRPRR